jgi:hypothetical protein
MAFGHVMGALTPRRMRGVVVYAVVTPRGLWKAWRGKAPLGRR